MELTKPEKVETLKDRFNKLSEGKKRLLIRAYTVQFGYGCLSSFYYKLDGKRPLRKFEQLFFETNLT